MTHLPLLTQNEAPLMFNESAPNNQKEKLLLMAKAAGFWKYEYQNWPGIEVRYGYAEALWVVPDKPEAGDEHPHGFYWNPLEDNEDAFLLIAQMSLDLAAVRVLADARAKEARDLHDKAAAFREAMFEVVCKNESK